MIGSAFAVTTMKEHLELFGGGNMRKAGIV